MKIYFDINQVSQKRTAGSTKDMTYPECMVREWGGSNIYAHNWYTETEEHRVSDLIKQLHPSLKEPQYILYALPCHQKKEVGAKTLVKFGRTYQFGVRRENIQKEYDVLIDEEYVRKFYTEKEQHFAERETHRMLSRFRVNVKKSKEFYQLSDEVIQFIVKSGFVRIA